MSILITVHCEFPVDRWSTCASRFCPGAKTIEEALAKAQAAGWSASGGLCPKHAGRGR